MTETIIGDQKRQTPRDQLVNHIAGMMEMRSHAARSLDGQWEILLMLPDKTMMGVGVNRKGALLALKEALGEWKKVRPEVYAEAKTQFYSSTGATIVSD